MKKKLFLLFLSFFLVFNDLAAQGEDYDYTFLNPGVRIGYSFGQGITVGVELRVGVNVGFIAGVATGIDYTIGSGADVFRLYLDGEVGFSSLGLVSAGLCSWRKETFFGAGSSPFLGVGRSTPQMMTAGLC